MPVGAGWIATLLWWVAASGGLDIAPHVQATGLESSTERRSTPLAPLDLPPDLKPPFAETSEAARKDGPLSGHTAQIRAPHLTPQIADIRDPFREPFLTSAKRTIRIARLPNDLQDPFRPRPRPCAKDVVIDGVHVEVQRPDALQTTRASRCRPVRRITAPSPDLRDPFDRRG